MQYDEVVAVDDATFAIPKGCICAVVGPNGAGKSSILKTIVGAITPTTGEITCMGQTGKSARAQVAYVPQRASVDWDFPITVAGVVEMGLYGELGLLRRLKASHRERIKKALAETGMSDLADRQIGALSGGQQQRVFLARALAQGRPMLALDEPFTGVDATTESALVDVLRRVRDGGASAVVVHHDLSTLREYFDHVVLLNQRIIAQGPVAETLTRENLRATYGGQLMVVDDDTMLLPGAGSRGAAK